MQYFTAASLSGGLSDKGCHNQLFTPLQGPQDHDSSCCCLGEPVGGSAPEERAQDGLVEHTRVSCSAHAVLGCSEPPRCSGELPNTLVPPHDPCIEVLLHRQWLQFQVLSSSQDT